MNTNISFPDHTEYATFYKPYIESIKGDSFFETLSNQKRNWTNELALLSEEQGNFSYAEGKWTIKELLQHMIDAERVFVYRALCIARGDDTMLPGFEENDYVLASNANKKTIENLVNSYVALRTSTTLFFQQLDEKVLTAIGNANGSSISVRAIAYIIAGHEKHHLAVLNERYQLNLTL